MFLSRAPSAILAALAALFFSQACGDGSSSDKDGVSDDDSQGDIEITNTGVNAAGEACTKTGDCDGKEICHPIAHVCTKEGGKCDEHSDCGRGKYCDEDGGHCLSGEAGSPCDVDRNCSTGSTCTGGLCACIGFVQEQETLGGPLDVYFVFDRTGSMGDDCDYEPGSSPPVGSKACYATYAFSDYLINVSPQVDTRLAFQFMSLPGDSCDGSAYSEALVPLVDLPINEDHQIVQEISDESFEGGYGTEIEGALRGIATFTENNETQGREMIGILMTDGDANDCNDDIDDLARIISDHREDTGIRTFIIGMDGATEDNLEKLAVAGGAEAHEDFCGGLDEPCHYWNVGDGSGDAISDALTAIVGQASPFSCEYELSEVQPSDGSTLDVSTLNVQLSEGSESTTIFNVEDKSACPKNEPAWYFDNNASPSAFSLCKSACELVTSASKGAQMSIVGGCSDTLVLR